MKMMTLTVLVWLMAGQSRLIANNKLTLSDAYKQAITIETLPNIVFSQVEGYEAPIIPFQVEVLSGSELKYEAKTFNGMKVLDRKICRRSEGLAPSTGFPAHYGFTPGRINADGDPLDVLVLGGDKWFAENRGKKVSPARGVRMIGIVKMEECGEKPCAKTGQWVQDWKLLAVDVGQKEFTKVREPKDLPPRIRKQIEAFFSHYKGFAGKHPKARVSGFGSAGEAIRFYSKAGVVYGDQRREEVQACRKIILDESRKTEQLFSVAQSKKGTQKELFKPSFNKKIVSCLERTFQADVFANHSIFEAYLAMSAYHLIGVKLKPKKAISLSNSLHYMEKLRKKKKKHYRFVGIDTNEGNYRNSNGFIEKVGSGQPILGWAKTKNRSKGCIGKTNPQHYDKDELVGVQY